jgi:hypothetical protein
MQTPRSLPPFSHEGAPSLLPCVSGHPPDGHFSLSHHVSLPPLQHFAGASHQTIACYICKCFRAKGPPLSLGALLSSLGPEYVPDDTRVHSIPAVFAESLKQRQVFDPPQQTGSAQSRVGEEDWK